MIDKTSKKWASKTENQENGLIARDEAIKLLNVSHRTLDRYIIKYNLSRTRQGRKMYLVYEQIKDLEKTNSFTNDIIQQSQNFNMIKLRHPESSQVGKIEDFENLTRDIEKTQGTALTKSREDVYKEFAEDLKRELREKNRELAASFFKIGELQGKLKTMVPFIEFRRKTLEIESIERKLLAEKVSGGRKVEIEQERYRKERFNKIIYIFLILTLLIIQILLIISFIKKT